MGLLLICSRCGKKKFSFNLTDGICHDCKNALIEEQRKAEMASAESLYQQLAELWKLTGSRCYQNFISIEEAQGAIQGCDTFDELLHSIPDCPRFKDVFLSHCTYISAYSCHNEDFGRMEVTNVDGTTVKIDFEQLLSMVGKCKEKATNIIQNSTVFISTCSMLPIVSIPIDMLAAPAERITPGMFESKNITSKTRVDKLSVFYAVDVETTGLNPMMNDIISLSAVKFLNFEPVEAFTTYIKPRNGLNPRAQKINGITEDDVKDAPYIEAVATAFISFITPESSPKKNPPIVGHNLSFDYNFLYANGIDTLCFSRPHYDTLGLARRQFKYLTSYKLDSLVYRILHVARADAHSSLSDALAAGMLFKEICKERMGF